METRPGLGPISELLSSRVAVQPDDVLVLFGPARHADFLVDSTASTFSLAWINEIRTSRTGATLTRAAYTREKAAPISETLAQTVLRAVAGLATPPVEDALGRPVFGLCVIYRAADHTVVRAIYYENCGVEDEGTEVRLRAPCVLDTLTLRGTPRDVTAVLRALADADATL